MGGFFFEFEAVRTASGPSRRVTRRWRLHETAPARRHRRDPTRGYVVIRTPSTRYRITSMLRAGTWAVLTYVRQDRWVDDPGSLDMDIKRCSHFLVREEGNHTREEGWYLLRGLESAMLSFDFRSPRGVRIHSKSPQKPPSAFPDGGESYQ